VEPFYFANGSIPVAKQEAFDNNSASQMKVHRFVFAIPVSSDRPFNKS
jgi:hypothetical protein